MYISCIHDISHGFCHSSSEHAEACTSVTHGQYIALTASVTQVVNMQKRVLLSLMDRCELLTQKKKSLCSQVRQGTNMELKRTLIRSLNVTKKKCLWLGVVSSHQPHNVVQTIPFFAIVAIRTFQLFELFEHLDNCFSSLCNSSVSFCKSSVYTFKRCT